MKYQDLYALLADEPEAKKYYNSLPDYVRDQISTRPTGISTLEDLQDYAENLLRRDE